MTRKTKRTILSIAIATIVLTGFFIQIFKSINTYNEYYIFAEIGECDNLLPSDQTNVKIEIYDTVSNDKNLQDLSYNNFFAMDYKSDSLQYEIFAYEFEDSDSALKYYVNVTGQTSYEKKLPLDDTDENKLLLASTGMFSYRLMVVYKNMAYQIIAPKQYKAELHDLLSSTFSIKIS